jgi:steroid delta-isomerase-like uncharacterized protein
MAAQDNKTVVRRCYEALNQEVWPKGNFTATDEFIAPDYVYHDPSQPQRGREGFRQLITLYRTAFPDARFTIEEQIAEGDKVLTRFTVTGTQKGRFLDIAPTNKKATVSALSLARVTNGKIAEEWERFDTLQLLQQLGAVPAMAGATR